MLSLVVCACSAAATEGEEEEEPGLVRLPMFMAAAAAELFNELVVAMVVSPVGGWDVCSFYIEFILNHTNSVTCQVGMSLAKVSPDKTSVQTTAVRFAAASCTDDTQTTIATFFFDLDAYRTTGCASGKLRRSVGELRPRVYLTLKRISEACMPSGSAPVCEGRGIKVLFWLS